MANYDWVPKELVGRFTHINGKLYSSCAVCGKIKQTAGKGAVLKIIARDGIDKFQHCSLHGSYGSGQWGAEEIASWPGNHKRCSKCKKIKSFSEYHKHSECLYGYNVVCMECRLPVSKQHYKNTPREYNLLHSAKSRAKRKGLEFDLDISDIVIPETCPVLKIPISSKPGNYAPSIDRINPTRGYTKDNIIIMSRRANMLKNNMLLAEVDALHSWMHENMHISWYHDYYMVQEDADGTIIRAAFLDEFTYAQSVEINLSPDLSSK